MSTRTRRRTHTDDPYTAETESFDTDLVFDDISDDDIEAFLEEQEDGKEPGFWNLPTAAGLSIITVGVAYLFQEMGLWAGFDLSVLANALPWLAGILIILLGFGVLSWKPKKKKDKKGKSKDTEATPEREIVVEEIKVKSSKDKKRLSKSSRNRKIAGVAGGLGEYFGIDPTLIRIAFVVAVIFGFGAAIPIYILLSFIMPKPESGTPRKEERITIIRS